MKKKQLVKSNTWVIHNGVSQEARDIIKRLAKEKKVTRGEVLNDLIIERDEESRVDGQKRYMEAVSIIEQNSIASQGHLIGVHNFNMHNTTYVPFVLSFGALNEEDMDRKLIEHIFNRLRHNSGKEPVLLPDPDKPWWKFWS